MGLTVRGSKVGVRSGAKLCSNIQQTSAVKVALLVSERAVHQSAGASGACVLLELSLVRLGVFVLTLGVLYPAVAGTP